MKNSSKKGFAHEKDKTWRTCWTWNDFIWTLFLRHNCFKRCSVQYYVFPEKLEPIENSDDDATYGAHCYYVKIKKDIVSPSAKRQQSMTLNYSKPSRTQNTAKSVAFWSPLCAITFTVNTLILFVLLAASELLKTFCHHNLIWLKFSKASFWFLLLNFITW